MNALPGSGGRTTSPQWTRERETRYRQAPKRGRCRRTRGPARKAPLWAEEDLEELSEEFGSNFPGALRRKATTTLRYCGAGRNVVSARGRCARAPSEPAVELLAHGGGGSIVGTTLDRERDARLDALGATERGEASVNPTTFVQVRVSAMRISMGSRRRRPRIVDLATDGLPPRSVDLEVGRGVPQLERI